MEKRDFKRDTHGKSELLGWDCGVSKAGVKHDKVLYSKVCTGLRPNRMIVLFTPRDAFFSVIFTLQ